MRGRIVRGIGGFYYVHCMDIVHCGGSQAYGAGKELYECRAKGIFRKDNRRPLVGDEVEIEVLDEEKKTGNISEILPRRSELVRPAVANVDQALVIFALAKPKPNFNLLDRFLVMLGRQGLACVICFNKMDADEEGKGAEYCRIYRDCGYRTLETSAETGEGIGALKELLAGKVTALAGPSGVGKSSIINCLQPDVVMETGEVSARIERGRHTTRHTELIAVGEDTYILDTPGFSSLGIFCPEKGELAACYPEFARYEKDCRFTGCSHIGERDCGVKAAVAEGAVSKMRYENYCLLYQELDCMQARTGKRAAGPYRR